MSAEVCPRCGSELRRFARKNDPTQYFWSCSGYRAGCTFHCDDRDGSPFLQTCPECGNVLVRKISGKTGKPYVACFNKEGHASHDVRFFAEDGSPRENAPSARGQFFCPECQGALLYRRVQKGPRAGNMVFLCPNTEGHADKKTHFFEDADGSPVFGGEPVK